MDAHSSRSLWRDGWARTTLLYEKNFDRPVYSPSIYKHRKPRLLAEAGLSRINLFASLRDGGRFDRDEAAKLASLAAARVVEKFGPRLTDGDIMEVRRMVEAKVEYA